MLHLPRIMLAAPGSGSGKTMITCGILQAFRERGQNPASFKCGPDYIDPMFHARVIGTPSRNLDTFFTDPQTTRYLFAKTAKDAGISVLEGVMGIYDGLGGISVKASSYDLAAVTETPVILIVNARGMSLSVIPLIQGYLNYQSQCRVSSRTETLNGCDVQHQHGHGIIRGVILNQTTQMTYHLLKDEIEKQTGVHVYGYVPKLEDAAVESRHLGLVTPNEIADLKSRLTRLGEELEQCLDLDGILALAQEAADYGEEELRLPESVGRYVDGWRQNVPETAGAPENQDAPEAASMQKNQDAPLLAVAQDEAFCFYYQDNLELLEILGAKLIPFSPLHDKGLPEGISGLLLGGGYPELYAEQLSQNDTMKASIKKAVDHGLPYLAECGGFMYLHEEMEDMDGRSWPVCGCIPGRSYRTKKLGRFGYITLSVRMEEEHPLETIAKDHPAKTTAESYPEALAAKDSQNENTAKAHQAAMTAENCDREQGTFGETEQHEMCRGLYENQRFRDQYISAGWGFLRPGETIRAHEFHYFDSTDPGKAYIAQKPIGKRTWDCIHASRQSVAGYPHLYYWSNPDFAARFVSCARKYRRRGI